jgi:hypothetical protein
MNIFKASSDSEPAFSFQEATVYKSDFLGSRYLHLF